MALSQEHLKQLALDICAAMGALERGMTPDELRDLAFLAGDKAGYLATVDAAVAFHSLPHEAQDPGYRKGTAMQPAKWADCLWRPTP